MFSLRCPFILSIALAALTSVAVPWIIAITVNLETGIGPSALIDPGADGALPMWLAHEFANTGSRTILAIPVTTELQRDTYLDWRAGLAEGIASKSEEIDDVTGRSPRWSDLRDEPPPHTQAIYEYRVGWPMLAVGSRVTRVHDPDSQLLDDLVLTVEGGIAIKELERPTRTIRHLPCLPIWTGLAVNSLLYWAVWMIVITTLRRARPGQNTAASDQDVTRSIEPPQPT